MSDDGVEKIYELTLALENRDPAWADPELCHLGAVALAERALSVIEHQLEPLLRGLGKVRREAMYHAIVAADGDDSAAIDAVDACWGETLNRVLWRIAGLEAVFDGEADW